MQAAEASECVLMIGDHPVSSDNRIMLLWDDKEREMKRKKRVYFPEKPTKPPSGPTPEPPDGEYAIDPTGVPNPAIQQLKDAVRAIAQLKAENKELRKQLRRWDHDSK